MDINAIRKWAKIEDIHYEVSNRELIDAICRLDLRLQKLLGMRFNEVDRTPMTFKIIAPFIPRMIGQPGPLSKSSVNALLMTARERIYLDLYQRKPNPQHTGINPLDDPALSY